MRCPTEARLRLRPAAAKPTWMSISRIPAPAFPRRSARGCSSRSFPRNRFTRAQVWGSSSPKRSSSVQAAPSNLRVRSGWGRPSAFTCQSRQWRLSRQMERNRILVVDDDPLIRGSLYEMLRGRRYEAEIAADGSEALGHLKRRSLQPVLPDWKMPQVDGVSLLSHIKSRYPDTNVVLITGFGNIGSAVEAMRQGAFDYLTKPIQDRKSAGQGKSVGIG